MHIHHHFMHILMRSSFSLMCWLVSWWLGTSFMAYLNYSFYLFTSPHALLVNTCHLGDYFAHMLRHIVGLKGGHPFLSCRWLSVIDIPHIEASYHGSIWLIWGWFPLWRVLCTFDGTSHFRRCHKSRDEVLHGFMPYFEDMSILKKSSCPRSWRHPTLKKI